MKQLPFTFRVLPLFGYRYFYWRILTGGRIQYLVKVGSFAPVFEMIEKIYLWDIIDRTVDGKVTKFWIILSLRISEFFLEDLFLFLFLSLFRNGRF